MAALAGGCGDDPADGGADATAAMVLETCAPGGDPVETEVCECAYRELTERFDDAQLEDLDRELRDDPETVPPEIRQVVLDCGFERVAPPTSKPAATSTSTTVLSRPGSGQPTSSTTATTSRA
jgi:hypothetical protein